MFILGPISLVNAHDSLSSPLEARVKVEKKWPLFWNLLLRKMLIISQYFINNQFLMIIFLMRCHYINALIFWSASGICKSLQYRVCMNNSHSIDYSQTVHFNPRLFIT